MFSVAVGKYMLLCHPDGLPDLYPEYVQHARLVDEMDLAGTDGTTCFVAVQEQLDWPSVVIAMRYQPAGGFHPGAALVPETGVLFVGAGERLAAYKVAPPQKLWEDKTEYGCFGWQRHAEYVLLSGELELAAWDWHGRKLWSTFVEPLWHYAIRGDIVNLDVMGRKSSFALAIGPSP